MQTNIYTPQHKIIAMLLRV